MYNLATDSLEAAGYEQYEISNWSKPGYECRHNLQYWRNLPYPGFGPGAHGYAGGVRYATLLSPHRYIRALQDVHEEYVFPEFACRRSIECCGSRRGDCRYAAHGACASPVKVSRDLPLKNVLAKDLLDIHGALIERFVNFGLLSRR